MKKGLFIATVCFLQLLSTGANAQGKYAGAYKKLIGTTFKDERHFTKLPGYKFMQGDMISDVNDPIVNSLYVFVKSGSAVVLFTQLTDTASKDLTIVDVIDIRNIQKGWEVKTAACQDGDAEGQIIVALVNPGKKEYTRIIKSAWICEPDRLRFEAIGTKNIKCLNEGQD